MSPGAYSDQGILPDRFRPAKRIYRNDVIFELGQTGQQRVRQQSNIGPHRGENIRQDDALDHSERMVGHYDHGATPRDSADVSRSALILRLQAFQDFGEEGVLGILNSLIESVEIAQQPVLEQRTEWLEPCTSQRGSLSWKLGL